MAAGATIKQKRKAGGFATEELAEGEIGVNTADVRLEFSTDGTDINLVTGGGGVSESLAIAYAVALG